MLDYKAERAGRKVFPNVSLKREGVVYVVNHPRRLEVSNGNL